MRALEPKLVTGRADEPIDEAFTALPKPESSERWCADTCLGSRNRTLQWCVWRPTLQGRPGQFAPDGPNGRLAGCRSAPSIPITASSATAQPTPAR